MSAIFFVRYIRRHSAAFVAAAIVLANFAFVLCSQGFCQWSKFKTLSNLHVDVNLIIKNVSFVQAYNAIEDSNLQEYIAQRKHDIKAVIYILAKADRLRQLSMSIELLCKNFNQRYRYPVVIFHEADFLPLVESVRQMGIVTDNTSGIFFQLVDLRVPDWYTKKFGEPSKSSSWLVFDKGCSFASVGYRSMCRFQAKLVYEQQVLRHFHYYWRLDDDSRIVSKIPYDVFDVLKTGGFSYGLYSSAIDECAGKIFDATKDYMKPRNITPTFFKKLGPDEVFLNNFEVSSFSFWRSPQYRDYIEHIDSLGGIYKHRWGDAPIKTLALSMFVPLREIYRYRNFTYLHGLHEIGERLATNFLA